MSPRTRGSSARTRTSRRTRTRSRIAPWRAMTDRAMTTRVPVARTRVRAAPRTAVPPRISPPARWSTRPSSRAVPSRRSSYSSSGCQAAPLWSEGRSPKRLMWGGRLLPRSDGEAVDRLLGGQPVLADADVDGERRIEVEGAAHRFLDQLRGGLHLVRWSLEEELVVDLEDQAGLEVRFLELLLGLDHRDLDDVRRGPLDRHVHREALALASHLRAA